VDRPFTQYSANATATVRQRAGAGHQAMERHGQHSRPAAGQRQQPRRRQGAVQGGVAGVQGEAPAGQTGEGLSRDEQAAIIGAWSNATP